LHGQFEIGQRYRCLSYDTTGIAFQIHFVQISIQR
jgi:hypothetical protein